MAKFSDRPTEATADDIIAVGHSTLSLRLSGLVSQCMVSECLAVRLACRDQRRRTRNGSAASRRCAIRYRYTFALLYFTAESRIRTETEDQPKSGVFCLHSAVAQSEFRYQ